jgi:hypothetical protein
MYGQNKDGDALSAVAEIYGAGFKEISTITAGDSSHTLSVADAGIVLISAALASGAVIKLPTANSASVGLKYQLLYTGTMAAASKIQLPNAGSAVFDGVVVQERAGSSGAGVAEAATVVAILAIVPGASKKSMELDENNETFGGGIGTSLEFVYASKTKVIVTGRMLVNVASTALDAVTSTMFTATGY